MMSARVSLTRSLAECRMHYLPNFLRRNYGLKVFAQQHKCYDMYDRDSNLHSAADNTRAWVRWARPLDMFLSSIIKIYIHKYLRQFRYSYWAHHMGVFKPLIKTSKKCKHGRDTRACTCAYKTVSSFPLVESNIRDSCATSRGTWPLGVVYPRALLFHSWRSVVLKEIIDN